MASCVLGPACTGGCVCFCSTVASHRCPLSPLSLQFVFGGVPMHPNSAVRGCSPVCVGHDVAVQGVRSLSLLCLVLLLRVFVFFSFFVSQPSSRCLDLRHASKVDRTHSSDVSPTLHSPLESATSATQNILPQSKNFLQGLQLLLASACAAVKPAFRCFVSRPLPKRRVQTWQPHRNCMLSKKKVLLDAM